MNMTEDMVNTINKTRFRNIAVEDRGTIDKMSECHIYEKGAPEGDCWTVKKGTPLVARGPFIEFDNGFGLLVQIVYTNVGSVTYPKSEEEK